MGQERRRRSSLGAVPSPLLEERSVHGEAQHGTHGGAEARPQPEGGVLQVGLCHVPGGNMKQSVGEWERKANSQKEERGQH